MRDVLDRYELQNYTSMALGKHFLKFGVRLRANRDTSVETSDFNGNFYVWFTPGSDLCGEWHAGNVSHYQRTAGLQITQQGLANGLILRADRGHGRRRQPYSITTGSASADVTYFDAGLYVQDDFHLRPNMTLSYGLRFESQNNVQ